MKLLLVRSACFLLLLLLPPPSWAQQDDVQQKKDSLLNVQLNEKLAKFKKRSKERLDDSLKRTQLEKNFLNFLPQIIPIIPAYKQTPKTGTLIKHLMHKNGLNAGRNKLT